MQLSSPLVRQLAPMLGLDATDLFVIASLPVLDDLVAWPLVANGAVKFLGT